MTTRFRSVLAVTVAALAFGVSTGASAGSPLGAIEKGRERQEEKAQNAEQPRQSSAPSRQQSAPPSNAQQDNRPRGGIAGAARESRGGNGGGSSQAPSRGNDRGNYSQPGGQSGGQSAGSARGNDSIVGFARRNMDSRKYNNGGNGGGYNGGGHSHRPPRIIQRMPSGYRDYNWGGNRYFYSGGYWYRPYGSSFITIGAPYGLFVGTLPGYYSSFYYGDTRYFYSDNTYYTYEPVRRGYVVARSPYGDDEEYENETLGDDLYIYPARGQSEQQQADDRYECHRWAASESKYDPLDDEYDASLRKDYQRAMTACLTGRGYSVN